MVLFKLFSVIFSEFWSDLPLDTFQTTLSISVVLRLTNNTTVVQVQVRSVCVCVLIYQPSSTIIVTYRSPLLYTLSFRSPLRSQNNNDKGYFTPYRQQTLFFVLSFSSFSCFPSSLSKWRNIINGTKQKKNCCCRKYMGVHYWRVDLIGP